MKERRRDGPAATRSRDSESAQVEVHYSAVVEGSKALFESTYQTQYPLTFRLLDGHGMAGLHLAVASMREGGRRLVRLPPHLHYGRWTRPPNAVRANERGRGGLGTFLGNPRSSQARTSPPIIARRHSSSRWTCCASATSARCTGPCAIGFVEEGPHAR